MEGVKRVIAGYSGGLEPFPNYRNIQDHVLALFVEFNPNKVSLNSILEMWYDNDDPWRDEESLLDEEDNGDIFNYERSAIYTTSPEQYEQVYQFLTKLAKTRPNEYLHVDIDRATNFYQAEEYHQDYIVKQVRAAKAHVEAYRNGEIKSGLFTIYE